MIPSADHCPRFVSLARAVGIKSGFSPLLHNVLFSVLKRIRNMTRSTILDKRSSALTRLSIEVVLVRSIDFNDLISDFAKAKPTKNIFNYTLIIYSF